MTSAGPVARPERTPYLADRCALVLHNGRCGRQRDSVRGEQLKGRQRLMSHSKAIRTVRIGKPEGLHARPAELFVSLALRFDAAIEVVKDDQRADAKSMLHVLTLAAVQGTELRIEAVGRDAAAAVDALAELVTRDFEVNGTDAPSIERAVGGELDETVDQRESD